MRIMRKIEEARCAAVKERMYCKSGNTEVEVNVEKPRTMVEVATELEKAKEAVRSCMDNDSGLVDIHELEYWARVVERRRIEIKKIIQKGGNIMALILIIGIIGLVLSGDITNMGR